MLPTIFSQIIQSKQTPKCQYRDLLSRYSAPRLNDHHLCRHFLSLKSVVAYIRTKLIERNKFGNSEKRPIKRDFRLSGGALYFNDF